MKIFTSEQIKDIDTYTIKNEPIASIDLMERAAARLFRWITDRYGRTEKFLVFTGPGNNGGDGLALARLMISGRYDVIVYHISFTENTSPDWDINRQRLESETKTQIHFIADKDQIPAISEKDVIIDAIFGSGLSRPVEGFPLDVIRHINKTLATIISIDIPSGLFGEDNGRNNPEGIINATYTLSFQFPKLSFLFAENDAFVGNWDVLPIGLNINVIEDTLTPYYFLQNEDIAFFLKRRNKFDHKGKFGHGLLIAGSKGKMGAAVLGARAALRTGIGLLTCHLPAGGIQIMQSSVPEAMVISDKSEDFVSEPCITDTFAAVGVGPGLGTGTDVQKALNLLVTECKRPMVIDADGLNLLSVNIEWFSFIGPETILTPHPKEFERLAGCTNNSFERLKLQVEFSMEHKCIVVLKGAYTSVSTPSGKVYFNSTGNPGMATGGSGDVLTGIILSLLAQNYATEDAAVLGVYLHGLAGDIAARKSGFESIIASDIIDNIGSAFNTIRKSEV